MVVIKCMYDKNIDGSGVGFLEVGVYLGCEVENSLLELVFFEGGLLYTVGDEIICLP